MSTPSRTSTPKISTQSLQKSGWARGPPQRSTSPTVTSTSGSPTRSQSPVLPPQSITTHARQLNALGRRGFTIGDGINVPFRDNVGISKQSPMTFGSADDHPATMYLSPADLPPIKTEDIKLFGSVPAVNGGSKSLPSFENRLGGPSSLKRSSSTSNLPPITSPTAVAPSLPKPEPPTSEPDSPSISTLKPAKVDIRKLFQNPPTSPSITPQLSPEIGTSRLNIGASAFVPKKITIKSLDGKEIDLDAWRKMNPPPSPVVTPSIQTHRKKIPLVRMETVEAKEKRLAEWREKALAELGGEGLIGEQMSKKAEKKKKRKEAREEKLKEEERKRREEEEAEREHVRREEEQMRRIVEEEERGREEKEERKVAKSKKSKFAKEAEEQKPEPQGGGVESPFEESPKNAKVEAFWRRLAPVARSALATVRIIEDLSRISYPEGVTGPRPELNVNPKKGKFKYNREFLLQFMPICTEKPDISLDLICLEAVGNRPHYPLTRGSKPGVPGGFTMGNFSTPTIKMTSEERFMMTQRSTSTTVPGPSMQDPMTQTGGQGDPGGNRTRSKRGGKLNKTIPPPGDYASSESGTAGVNPAAKVPLSPIFCADDADVVIRAAGTLDFRAHKCILSFASQIFKDMFAISQPPSDTLPRVDTHESAKTWENILRVLYPLPNPTIDDLDDLESLFLAAKKYRIQIIVDSYKQCFEDRRFIQQDPLHLYAIACACGLDSQAKYLARHAEHLKVARRFDAGNLTGLKAESYVRLVSFLAVRDYEWYQILGKDLTSFGVCCPCNEGLKEEFYNEIRENLKIWHLQAEEIYFKALEDPHRLRSECVVTKNCVFAASVIKSSIERRIKEREAVCDRLMWREEPGR